MAKKKGPTSGAEATFLGHRGRKRALVQADDNGAFVRALHDALRDILAEERRRAA